MLVLLVEDEPLVEVIAMEFLRDGGHEVLCASRGQEAVALFRDAQPRPDALLIDNRLPDMLGWEVAVICRSIAPYVPIAMCAGDSRTGVRDLAGVVQIPKPFTAQQLLKGLAQAVRNSSVA